VFDNQEKVRIVRRVLLGLAAVGVKRICYMPDYFGIVRRALDPIKISAEVSPVEVTLQGNQEDSVEAGRVMESGGVACIVTVGGDGTNRAVVKGTLSSPILPISTGTNNVFPFMVEGTIAGLAAGLVATRKVTLEEGGFTSTLLEVVMDGKAVDLALVDAVVYDDVFVGSRAVWDMDRVRQVFLNRAEPDSIGLSAIGGLIAPIRAWEPRCLHLELGNHGLPVTAPVAPGMVKRLLVSQKEIMNVDEAAEVRFVPSVLALDGEREVEVKPGQRVSLRLSRNGPKVVDVKRTMAAAAKKGALNV